MADMRFRGWTTEAVRYFEGLEADNSKAYWTAHREEYERTVRAPMLALIDELASRYGTFHLFRPNRDVRFSKDKSPYKTAIGAVTEGDGGESYYIQLSAEGLFLGAGYYRMTSDQLARYRDAVDDDRAGESLARVVRDLRTRRFTIGGASLKTAPRGFARDHPRVELLRHKGLYASRAFPVAPWLGTRGCLSRITKAWDGAAPLSRWLARHVGPSTEPPPDAR